MFSSSEMDVDGPCAAPQSTSITTSMTDPLATIGLFLIAVSFFMAIIYYATGNFDTDNRQATFSSTANKIMMKYHSNRREDHRYKESAEELHPIHMEMIAAKINETIHMLERFCGPLLCILKLKISNI